MSPSRATRRDNATTTDQCEISFLNSKLKNVNDLEVKGFVFKIIPQDYTHTDSYETSDTFLTFFSEKELEEKQSKIRVIQCWSDWQPREAFPCWGVRINNNIDEDNLSEQSYRNKNQETGKIPTAIVPSFYQVRQFGVNVTINEKAVNKAKKILNLRTNQEKQTAIKKFNAKYCSFVYSGKFSAGAWFGTEATESPLQPLNGHDSTKEQECAAKETEQVR